MTQTSALLPPWFLAPFLRSRSPHGAANIALGLMAMVLLATSLASTTLEGQEPGVAEQDTAALAQDSLVAEEVEQVTDERAAQDEVIRNQLQAVFDRVPDLARVEVTVDAGVVHLEGTVLRNETRTRAGELAAEMEGVLFLDNRIQESTSLEEQFQPTWTRLRELGVGALVKLPLVLVALIIITAAGFIGTWLSRWGGPKSLQFDNPFLQNLLQRFLRFIVILAALLLALDLLNATPLVGALVGTAGLAGIALSFAFKDIIENYLAGTILAFRQPFEKNDLIRVEGFEGKVVRLTARETILMNLDGDHVRLPNALILRSPMLNFTRNPLRRFHFDARVRTSDDLTLARDAAKTALSGMAGVLRDPAPQVLARELNDDAVTLRFIGWVDQRDVDLIRMKSEAIRTVKETLEAE
ncbi:MAG: mechanosensitive ion channel, partial [Thioalkalivibrio sp.]|nr:mechanosensitive ion channel [Thioalkalivibrio sp.]